MRTYSNPLDLLISINIVSFKSGRLYFSLFLIVHVLLIIIQNASLAMQEACASIIIARYYFDSGTGIRDGIVAPFPFQLDFLLVE